MAKHRLTRMEQARGFRKALRSGKTPPWLKPAISNRKALSVSASSVRG